MRIAFRITISQRIMTMLCVLVIIVAALAHL